MPLNHPRLFEILERSTIWAPRGTNLDRPVDTAYTIGLIQIDQGTVGVVSIEEVQREFMDILFELDLWHRGTTGQGLREIFEIVGDGVWFLRLWVLAQQFGLFPAPGAVLVYDLHLQLSASITVS